MPVIIHPTAFTPATEIELAPWRRIGTATISDALDRAGGMDAAIKPIADGMRCVGEALTVRPMIGDNSALHYAMTVAWPGAVVVVESRGHDGAALWGDVIGHAARLRGVAGAVIDGVVRDVSELRRTAQPIFARGAVPTGPHRQVGGEIGGPVQCGGCPVQPGDLIVGDDDGVVVVPRARLAATLERARAILAREEEVHAALDAGRTTIDINAMPPPGELGRAPR